MQAKVEEGIVNLEKHIENSEIYMKPVVASTSSDDGEEDRCIRSHTARYGVEAIVCAISHRSAYGGSWPGGLRKPLTGKKACFIPCMNPISP